MNIANSPPANPNPWVQNAQDYTRRHRADRKLRAHVATVDYLLAGHIGNSAKVTLTDLIQHVNSHIRASYNRESFQQQVLSDLKQEGILTTFIYGGGGVFIPSCDDDVNQSLGYVVQRVTRELENIRAVVDASPRLQLQSRLLAVAIAVCRAFGLNTP